MRHFQIKLFQVLSMLTTATAAQAVSLDSSFTYQGRFADAEQNPLSGNVNLRFQIYSADKQCLLYEESQAATLTKNQKGVVTVKVGSMPGSAKRTTKDPGLLMRDVFSNEKILSLVNANCPSGYVPAGGDGRVLRVFLNDGVKETAISDQQISTVPTALVAESIQGLTLTDLDKRFAGTDGKDGKDGLNGKDGINGKDGAQGPAGKDGIAGKNGIDGKNGKDGLNGKGGLNGKDGAPGAPGKAGANGLNGPSGEVGKQGPQGLQGLQGPKGADGRGVAAIGSSCPAGHHMKGLNANGTLQCESLATYMFNPAKIKLFSNVATGVVSYAKVMCPVGAVRLSCSGTRQKDQQDTCDEENCGLIGVRPIQEGTQQGCDVSIDTDNGTIPAVYAICYVP